VTLSDSTSTVTFLFSDVEGSTALLRKLRDGYHDVIGMHNDLLRAVWTEAAGTELDADGDSFFVAFRRPREAVDAAVAAQRALAEHDWPKDAEVRIRIGIHTGEASFVGDQYVGLAVHRAARICDAGHGGQTLVSETTRSLLVDEEEEFEHFQLHDLGPQVLKDFDRPVRIYQLTISGLSGEFPELRTAGQGAATTLADRQDELAAAPGSDGGVRVVIVDDQALVRAGFRMILEAETDIAVVGEASDGGEAVSECERLNPDVVLMDVRMPEVDGIEATRRLLGREGMETKVVMLTTFDMDEYVYDALRAGASGFLLKDVPPEQLVDGIRSVASGDALLAPTVTRRVIEEFIRRPPSSVRALPAKLEDLTARELEVLQLVARGLSNAEIAKELFVSETTVKTHVAHVLLKLDLRDRVQAVVLAYESGLIQPGEE
jgi:DNA-binding NarL/FixJ family response regulator/class 3 adenylate cyclase